MDVSVCLLSIFMLAQLAGAVEHTNFLSAVG